MKSWTDPVIGGCWGARRSHYCYYTDKRRHQTWLPTLKCPMIHRVQWQEASVRLLSTRLNWIKKNDLVMTPMIIVCYVSFIPQEDTKLCCCLSLDTKSDVDIRQVHTYDAQPEMARRIRYLSQDTDSQLEGLPELHNNPVDFRRPRLALLRSQFQLNVFV